VFLYRPFALLTCKPAATGSRGTALSTERKFRERPLKTIFAKQGKA